MLTLPPTVSRHAQVLRLQPGDEITLFNGEGGQWTAHIARMGRSDVEAEVGHHLACDRELSTVVNLCVGVPANDRFEWLIEKATELGVTTIQPMLCARSVFKLSGERAERKREHWTGIAIAAAEQCGATRVPRIEPLKTLRELIDLRRAADVPPADRWLLSLSESRPLTDRWQEHIQNGATRNPLEIFSGPEGGLTPDEETALRALGVLPTTLGARILRAETAPLAALSWIALQPPPVPAKSSKATLPPHSQVDLRQITDT